MSTLAEGNDPTSPAPAGLDAPTGPIQPAGPTGTTELPVLAATRGAGTEDVAPAKWVGRARPRAPQPDRPPVDPYWPPMGYAGDEHPPMALVRPGRGRGRTVLITVGVLAAVCAFGSVFVLLAMTLAKPSVNTGATHAASVKPPATHTLTAPPTPTLAGVGDAVRDGKFEFVVKDVHCGRKAVGEGFFTRHPDGQFCMVDVSVRNIGSSAQTFSDLFQKAYDSNGTSYQADSTAGYMVNRGETLWHNLSPGDEQTGTLVFDVSKKADLAQLELHDSPFSNGVIVTL